MDRGHQRPLNVDEAKRRLLRAGEEVGPGAMIHQHPVLAGVVAFGTGALLARNPALRRRAFAVLGMTSGRPQAVLSLLLLAVHFLRAKRNS